jgi:hypothetical protein
MPSIIRLLEESAAMNTSNTSLSHLYFTFVGMKVYDADNINIGRVRHVYFADDEPVDYMPRLTVAMNNLRNYSLESYSYVIRHGFILVTKEHFQYAYIVKEEQILSVDKICVYLETRAQNLLIC